MLLPAIANSEVRKFPFHRPSATGGTPKFGDFRLGKRHEWPNS